MRCRICRNDNLIEIGSLGEIAISGFTTVPEDGDKYELALVYCEGCALLQLSQDVPRNLLYSKYWYQSHINPVIVNDLKEIARHVETPCVDIGANDGTLLSFVEDGDKYAVDPSDIQPNGFNWIKHYWEDEEVYFNRKFKTITAIACLYDLPDPNKFVRKVKEYLDDDGQFICQLMTLKPMIENNDVGNICHEHIEFYSYKSLVRLFENNGLEIYKVESNEMNGGSYRIFVKHYQNGSIDYPEHTYNVSELKDFFSRVVRNKTEMILGLRKYIERGLNIYGYGASTKANTILQYYDIPLKGIVDVNPDKLGKYTIATHIPIIGEIPDDCDVLWVFPYGFIDYFKKKEKNYKGKWVTSIPEYKLC